MHAVRVVRLSSQDTIDTIRELLGKMPPATQVWLIVPRRLKCVRKLLNLKRLQYTAEKSALDLRLVSRHFYTRALAREAGIPSYFFLPPRLHGRAQSSSDILQITAKGKKGSNSGASVEKTLPARLRRRPGNIGISTALLALVVTIAFAAVILGTAAAMIPQAEIVLIPTSEAVSTQFPVTASTTHKQIDYEELIIPARVVQVIIEGQGETPSSGYEDISDEHASGEVVFANLTGESVTVPKGTMVRTSSGVNVRFYTVAEIELSPTLYAHQRVGIIALEPGPAGNVKPLTINAVEGEIAQSVSVVNDKATEGGTLKRVPIVSSQDFDRLRNDLLARLQREAYDKLVTELDEDEFIPPDSVEVQVMEQRYDQEVNQRSNVLSMRMKIVARGIAVDTASLDELAIRLLETKTGDEVRAIEDSLVVKQDEQLQVEKDKVRLNVSAHCEVAPRVNLESTKKALRGKEIPEAETWLQENLSLQEAPQIDVLPEWWNRIPLLPLRTEITLSAG